MPAAWAIASWGHAALEAQLAEVAAEEFSFGLYGLRHAAGFLLTFNANRLKPSLKLRRLPIMLDPDFVHRIRSIFLHERPYVSICDASSLLGWSREEAEAAVAAGEIEVARTWVGEVVETREVVAKARERWPAEVIEEALGREAAIVLPPGLRTHSVHARLPSIRSRWSSISRMRSRRASGISSRSSSRTLPASICASSQS